MSVVSNICGWIHVGKSDRHVLREFFNRIKAAKVRGEGLTRAQRKAIYREALDCHHANQDLYHDVMRGSI